RKGKSFGGPAAIENQSKSEGYDLQILALKRKKASVLDGFESVLHVPRYFTNSDENRAIYNNGVKKAEIMAFRLDIAIQVYLSTLMPQMIEIVCKGINKQPLSKHESEKYRAIKSRIKEKYLTHYWTLIEKQRHLLMQYISLLGMDSDQAREDSKKAWLRAINQAATETYETLCNQDSPRQLRAYVAGWHILHPSKSESQEAA
ncbi:MAG: type I-E CRISPR-associated protein Cse1/CasA, partial [Methylomicrobium sp.]|nr:type I-E CRISPR-associated protein Cse1/CasA [Methylomicrobium sp.]